MSSNTFCLVVAGGVGNRFGYELPKQYYTVNGQSIIRRTVEEMLNFVDNVCVVIREQDKEIYNRVMYGMDILPSVIGGDERIDSVYNGLDFLAKHNPEYILVHDSVRPFFSRRMMKELLNYLHSDEYTGVVPVSKVNDSMISITEDNSAKVVDRSTLYNVQTPQGFRFEALLKCYKNITHNNYLDDSSIVRDFGHSIKYIEGDKFNIKITRQEDLFAFS